MTKKEERKLHIKTCARLLFIDQGIDLTTFSQIAKSAEVGEATVYRHYNNKGELAFDIAMDYGKDFATTVLGRLEKHTGTHVEKFELILEYYIELFKCQPDYFIYLEHFDNFIMHSERQPLGFEAYEQLFMGINRKICDINNGELPDSSVNKDMDIDLATHTFNVSFLSLCQKLLIRGQVLHEDVRHDPIDALRLLKEIMIASISK